jgi:hypothetical protein
LKSHTQNNSFEKSYHYERDYNREYDNRTYHYACPVVYAAPVVVLVTKWIGKKTKAKGKTVYHVDKECYKIRSEPMEVPQSEIEYHNMTCCMYCNPETEHPAKQQTQTLEYQQALKEAANES